MESQRNVLEEELEREKEWREFREKGIIKRGIQRKGIKEREGSKETLKEEFVRERE